MYASVSRQFLETLPVGLWNKWVREIVCPRRVLRLLSDVSHVVPTAGLHICPSRNSCCTCARFRTLTMHRPTSNDGEDLFFFFLIEWQCIWKTAPTWTEITALRGTKQASGYISAPRMYGITLRPKKGHWNEFVLPHLQWPSNFNCKQYWDSPFKRW